MLTQSDYRARRLRIAVLFEEIGPNKEGIGAGPRIGASFMARALRRHSLHNVDLFCLTDVTDQLCREFVQPIRFHQGGDRHISEVLRGYEFVQVVNGKWLAQKVRSLVTNVIIGPNVLFSFPYRFPNRPSPNALSQKEAMQREEDICQQQWVASIFPNESLETLFTTRFAQHTSHFCWPYGVDEEVFRPSRVERDGIVWVGSLNPEKGLDLANAVRVICPGEKWTMLGAEKPFRYGEHVEVLQRAKAVLFTSKSETQGLAALEAIFCGAPTVVAKHYVDVHGKAQLYTPPYVYDQETALVANRDPKDLAAKLNYFLNDQNRATQFSERAVKFCKMFFSLASSAAQYDALMQRIAWEKESNLTMPQHVENCLRASQVAEALDLARFVVSGEPFSLKARLLMLRVLHELKNYDQEFVEQFEWISRLTMGHEATNGLYRTGGGGSKS